MKSLHLDVNQYKSIYKYLNSKVDFIEIKFEKRVQF